jgi:hypothetical protein
LKAGWKTPTHATESNCAIWSAASGCHSNLESEIRYVVEELGAGRRCLRLPRIHHRTGKLHDEISTLPGGVAGDREPRRHVRLLAAGRREGRRFQADRRGRWRTLLRGHDEADAGRKRSGRNVHTKTFTHAHSMNSGLMNRE